jgi:hypothetical protein
MLCELFWKWWPEGIYSVVSIFSCVNVVILALLVVMVPSHVRFRLDFAVGLLQGYKLVVAIIHPLSRYRSTNTWDEDGLELGSAPAASRWLHPVQAGGRRVLIENMYSLELSEVNRNMVESLCCSRLLQCATKICIKSSISFYSCFSTSVWVAIYLIDFSSIVLKYVCPNE